MGENSPTQPEQPSRPHVPRSYGIRADQEGMLPWRWLSERMASARNYWIGTTRPDGRPHSTPVWGVWVDEAFYFGTDSSSRKGRNLAANPAMVVHLESGDEVVILEGVAERVNDPMPDLFARIADAYAAKYDGFRPNHPADGEGLYTLNVRVAFAWQEQNYPNSATRWRFNPA